jgi:hypothetical protein
MAVTWEYRGRGFTFLPLTPGPRAGDAGGSRTESRQERNYKVGRSRWGQLFGPLTYACCRADDARQARAAAAARRYAERREILRRLRNDDRDSGLPAF